jgi:hypothetical protein
MIIFTRVHIDIFINIASQERMRLRPRVQVHRLHVLVLKQSLIG